MIDKLTTQEQRDLSLLSFAVVPEETAAAAPEWSPKCPAPGTYDVPYDEYRAWPASNASALKLGYHVSPKHMKACIDGLLDSDSRDRKFGRAAHCRLLEPDVFRERFLVAGRCQEPIASGKRKGQPCGNWGRVYDEAAKVWYCGSHGKAHPEATEPGEYIDEDEASRLERMVESVFAHKVVKLLRAHGGCEVSVVWDRDGFACKARFDKWIQGETCPDTLVDLKKCRPCHADDESLQRAVRAYGWDMQAAWYVDGAERISGTRPLFAWAFLEDGEPFDVRPVWASKAMLEVGSIKVRQAFELYKQCVQTGKWPGYTQEIEELQPAAWECSRYGIQP